MNLAERMELRLREEAERAKREYLGPEHKKVHDARIQVWYDAARLARMVVQDEARKSR